MNREHFQAFIWLRWRLRVNQMRRGGTVNAILVAILAGGVVVLAITLFVSFLLIGLLALPNASPAVLLYVWDGLVVVFLFLWAIGLLTEVQRAEALSLEKFLHLPVSLTGAFVINYLSSLASLVLILFLPPFLALALALVVVRGPAMLLTFPLLVAFLFMVTALTYQFQGWLASLMVNPRRRRTVIVFVTFGFILVCQLPNLVNLYQPWKSRIPDQSAFLNQQAELRKSLESRAITLEQFQKQLDALQTVNKAQNENAKRETWQQVENTTRLVSLVLPPGWLPLGAAAAAEGVAWPALLGTLGLTLIGSASLWRAYRTTLRLYTGQFTTGKLIEAAPSVVAPSKPAKPSVDLLERHLPWLSEQATAVALSSFRSLARAPEAKMLLIGPLIAGVVFGGIMISHGVNVPGPVRPLLPFAAIALVLLCMVQLLGNLFGFDRGGFRAYVLSPARRRDILLGKNVAYASLTFGMTIPMIVVLQVVAPMRFDWFLAAGPQMLSMYLAYCLVGNVVSIFGPMPIAQGTLKPVNAKLVPVLLQLALVFVLPMVWAPLLGPLGAEFGLEALGWRHGLPINLFFSLVECAVFGLLYHLLLNWQGQLLQAREQKILEIVSIKDR